MPRQLVFVGRVLVRRNKTNTTVRTCLHHQTPQLEAQQSAVDPLHIKLPVDGKGHKLTSGSVTAYKEQLTSLPTDSMIGKVLNEKVRSPPGA